MNATKCAKTVAASLCLATAMFLSEPASAVIIWNGVSQNGIVFNGLLLNNTLLNGVRGDAQGSPRLEAITLRDGRMLLTDGRRSNLSGQSHEVQVGGPIGTK